jgi:hypothetical protein
MKLKLRVIGRTFAEALFWVAFYYAVRFSETLSGDTSHREWLIFFMIFLFALRTRLSDRNDQGKIGFGVKTASGVESRAT